MATVRDARRALDRGDVDEAMVMLWNALEPLRLDGDGAGLERVGQLASEIASGAESSYAVEAERLLAAVRALTAEGATPSATVEHGLPETLERWIDEAVRSGERVGGDDRPPTLEEVDDAEEGGRRLGPLVWALLAGLFLLLNVLGNVFGDG
jgi:hypothetical protein